MKIQLSPHVLAAGVLASGTVLGISPAEAGGYKFCGNGSNGGFHRPTHAPKHHGKQAHTPAPHAPVANHPAPPANKPSYPPVANHPAPPATTPSYTPVANHPAPPATTPAHPGGHKPSANTWQGTPSYTPVANHPAPPATTPAHPGGHKPYANNPWKGNGSNHNPKMEPKKHHAGNHGTDKKDYKTPDPVAYTPKTESGWKDKGSNYDPKMEPKTPYGSNYGKGHGSDKPKMDPPKPATPVVVTPPPSKPTNNNCWKGNGSNHNPKPQMHNPKGGGGKTYCYAQG
jgi:hypothetical protein